ncbi:MAG TPA: UvrD-helicase domain-containing protein [Bryobacteraceae bacterium]|nr:UvrD-helicase domain-containing protein [Bryobacteraceae bacterium]
MIADSAARLRALDVSQSFIVQAPAGSGKTELLIQRYLKLLETVDTPGAVVAITFTRKAAGEMRSRVMAALRAAHGGQAPSAGHEQLTFEIARGVLRREQERGWNLLQNPARLRIETIDALCAEITRRMPWLARFGAMPEIVEKADAFYREAARNTIAHLRTGNAAVADLLLHLDNDFRRASQLIAQMLAKRDQWLRHTGGNPDFDILRSELEDSLQRLIVVELRQLRGAMDGDVAAEIAFLQELERFPGAAIEDLESWWQIAELLLTKNGDLRKRAGAGAFPAGHPHKRRCDQLLARLQSDTVLIDCLRRVRELPAPRFSESQWQAVRSVVSLLTLAVAELQLVFREHGCVDFAELSIRASGALGTADAPEDLALSLGHRIQHILVDEFQDTSYTQFELIEKLTAGWEPGDGRTLFLVGDPMQSIYRFRQADVSLFLKARLEGIGAIRLEPLVLSVNFRSRPDLVEWVNRTFESILPAADDIESGAVAYSASVPGSAAADATIGTHAFVDGRDEADRVIELIATHAAGNVAVLVRSRAHLLEIAAALQRHRIAYQAIEIDQLGERQVVEDLMALTFALLHPGDRVSWLAILRAPWCGLTLADLHALAGADHRAAVWDLLRGRQAALSEDGRARIERIVPVLDPALRERGRLPLRDWVEQTWLRLGGPACVHDEAALEDAAAYFDLLETLAEGADLADFAWFREQVNGLFAPPDSAAGDRLQLMTIHKAKGLEFDTVILPGLGAAPRSDDPSLLLCVEHGRELLLAPIAESGGDDPIYRYLSKLEARKLEQEAARLLYVAATRARCNLHLLGAIREKADGTWAAPDARSFLKLLWPAIGERFANPVRHQDTQQSASARMIRRLPAGWRVPPPPEAVAWERSGLEQEQAAAAPSEWASDRARFAGDALHGFLQRIAQEGLECWNEDRVRSLRAASRAVLANLGVAPRDLSWAVDRVEKGLVRTLRDPRGRWALEKHADAACELPVVGWIGGELCEAVMDRTFADESGVRWIIDYKTSEPGDENLENFLEAEKERYREQLERYARLMALRDARPIRLGLYFPLLSEWREWSAGVVRHKQALLFEL